MTLLRLRPALSEGIAPLLAASLLSFAIWVSGPLLVIAQHRPLDSVTSRLTAIALLWLGLAAVLCWKNLMTRRQEAAFLRDLSMIDPTLPWEELRSTPGARPLHLRPWFVVIGPPGVGKTTAILNSGLRFAPSRAAGGAVQAGRGWQIWPAAEAVLIEISEGTIPQARTELLKARRGQNPLAGIILMAGLTEFAEGASGNPLGTPELAPLLSAFGADRRESIPVWVLLTRADLIPGFAETFPLEGTSPGHLGFSLPAPRRGAEIDLAAQVSQRFDALVSRLSNHAADTLAMQVDPGGSHMAISFPLAMAALRPRVTDWLAQIFQPLHDGPTAVLRGVWICSGGGGGRLVDPLRATLLRNFGMTRQLPEGGAPPREPRFLKGFLHRILLPEAGLTEARGGWKRVVPFNAVLALGAGLAVPLVQHDAASEALIARVAQQVGDVGSLIPQGTDLNSDPVPILAALDGLRRLPGAPEGEGFHAPSGPSTGLYMGDFLQNGARLAYRDGLNHLLLPRLLLRLEEVMQARVNEPEVIFPTLKTYLILGRAGPMVQSHVLEWFAADWAGQGGGAVSPAQQARLAVHLGALMRQPMQAVALDASLIAQIRGVLARTPQARRIYSQIVARAGAEAATPFRVAEVAGPGAAQMLRRPSGAGLDQGVEGLYTRQGFHQIFLPQLADLASLLQNEAWVIGPARLPAVGDQAQRAIARDVLGIYYRDYIARYEALLGDIDIVPFDNPQHESEVLAQLSRSDAPLFNLLSGISRQSLLTLPDDATATAPVGPVRGGPGNATGGDSPGAVVDGHFRALRDLVNGAGGQLSAFGRVQAVLADPDGRIAVPVRGGAQDRSGPLGRWLAQIRGGYAAPGGSGRRNRLTQLWQREVLPLCERVTQGGFPLQPGAEAEVDPKDFTALFGPDGAMERFYRTHLSDTARGGTAQSGASEGALALSPFVVAAFDRAAQIRDGFFAKGQGGGVSFRLKPHAPEAQIGRVTLEADGQRSDYTGHDQGYILLPWTGRPGMARISLEPEREDVENSLSRQGPWALIRLLSAAEMRPSAEGGTILHYRIAGRRVGFTLENRGNFAETLAALAAFKCPQSF